MTNRLDNRVKTQKELSVGKEAQPTSEETALSTKDVLLQILDLQKQQLVESKLISLKLDCLQLDELTVDDLEN